MVLNISVFGLGYVGAVSCACLSERGHRIVGVDTNPTKVDLINRGQSPVVEDRIDELIAAGAIHDHAARLHSYELLAGLGARLAAPAGAAAA